MIPKQQCLLEAVSAAQKEAESKHIKQTKFTPPKGRCQQRCLEILLSHPEGILSHDLRYATKTQNVAHVRKKLNGKGFFNECEMERVIDDDGYEYQIGRCRLTKVGLQNARAFFRGA